MTKAILTFKMPKTCDKCPLFVSKFATPTFCVMGAEYTDKEIEDTKDGNLMMYYEGCLPKRPKACPLKFYDRKEQSNADSD